MQPTGTSTYVRKYVLEIHVPMKSEMDAEKGTRTQQMSQAPVGKSEARRGPTAGRMQSRAKGQESKLVRKDPAQTAAERQN